MPSEYLSESIRHDKHNRFHHLEAELLDAIGSRDFELSREDLKGGALVKRLREKLARERS